MSKIYLKYLQKNKILILSLFLISNISFANTNNLSDAQLKSYYINLSKNNFDNYISKETYEQENINQDNPIDAFKKEVSQQEQKTITNQTCWTMAGNHYGIDPWILFAYAKTESNFNPKAINKQNKNKTYDIGMMQINSIWLPTLKKLGIKESMLYDPCQSIYVAAWIVKTNFDRYGKTYNGIVAYNVGNPNRKDAKEAAKRYYAKFEKNYKYLVATYNK